MSNNKETKEDSKFGEARESESDSLQLPTQENNGDLPAAVSNVAQKFAEVARADQRAQTKKVWEFLLKEEKDLMALNLEQLAIVLLVIVPETMKLRVVHSMGYGTHTFTTVNPMAGKVLGLIGDGDEDLDPDPVVLPATIFKHMKMLVPMEAEADVAIAGGKQLKHILSLQQRMR